VAERIISEVSVTMSSNLETSSASMNPNLLTILEDIKA